MPKERRIKKKYTEHQLLEAIAAVKNGESYNKASKRYNIPVATLHDKLSQKYSCGKSQPGPNSSFSIEQENRLISFIKHMAQIGYGLSIKEIPGIVKDELDRVEEIARQNGGESVRKKFKDNTPSMGWVYRLLKRYPDLSQRMPETLGYQRANVSERTIREWFRKVSVFLKDEHNIDAKQFFSDVNSSRIFNLDESGFPLGGTNGKLKVITEKGAKNVYKVGPDSREQITVLGCCSADGALQNPFVIMPGTRPTFNFQGTNPEDFDVGKSPNGWISADCFFGWLANVFYPRVRDEVEFPIIIFMDGHSSHMNFAVSEFCREHSIILLCFPAHASHIIQPLDVAVYGPLKKFWNESLNNFGKKYRGLTMSKAHFFPVFDEAWKKAVDRPQNVIAGFRKCGLLPFDPEVLPYDRLINTNSIEKMSKSTTSADEKLGIIRMMQMIVHNLTPDMVSLFERRYDENYNIVDQSNMNSLWRIYRDGRKMTENKSLPEFNNTENTELNGSITPDQIAAVDGELTNQEITERLEHPETSIDEAIANVPSCSYSSTPHVPLSSSSPKRNLPSSGSVNAAISCTPLNCSIRSEVSLPEDQRQATVSLHGEGDNSMLNSTAISQPSTSSSTNWDCSPFKHHIKISDNVVIARKATKTKPKTPVAISGKEYYEFIQKQNLEKIQKQKEKEERQKAREEKKKNPPAKKKIAAKKVLNESMSEESTDDEVIMGVEDDSMSEIDDDMESCHACLGKDAWDEPNAWIGCSGKKCRKWFHKECLSADIVKMDEDELEKFNYYCKFCEKKVKK